MVLPKYIKDVAAQMLEFGYDLHRQDKSGPVSPGGSSSKPIKIHAGSEASLVNNALADLSGYARFFKLADQGNRSNEVLIYHFDQQLLMELLVLSLTTLLTRYPFLRDMYPNEGKRLSRFCLVMPSTEVSFLLLDHRFPSNVIFPCRYTPSGQTGKWDLSSTGLACAPN